MPAVRQRRDYGIGAIDTSTDRDRLYREIRSRLGRQSAWQRGELIKATEIADETRLALGTVTKTLVRLVAEGALHPHHGKGYRIVDVAAGPRQTTLVSASEFWVREGFDCVSVLDHDVCSVRRLRDLSPGDADGRLKRLITERLQIKDTEPILLLRRARGIRPQRSRRPIRWAILESLFLIAGRLPFDETDIKSALQPATTRSPTGDLSLHHLMTSRRIELQRSEYSLVLSPLSGRDARMWRGLTPRPHLSPSKSFIRLEAVTYGAGHPLLFTREHLVPDMFVLGVSGFRFGRPAPAAEATSSIEERKY